MEFFQPIRELCDYEEANLLKEAKELVEIASYMVNAGHYGTTTGAKFTTTVCPSGDCVLVQKYGITSEDLRAKITKLFDAFQPKGFVKLVGESLWKFEVDYSIPEGIE